MRIASTVVPVFPLPGTVFFPQTVLPLHVFEPRYRAMVRDASAEGGLIAMALLLPGWEANYAGHPPFHALGTLGRIADLHQLRDGRFNLRLIGLGRVEFIEQPSGRPYRLARVEPRPETPADDAAPAMARAKIDLLASFGYLTRLLRDRAGAGLVLDDRVPLEPAVNFVASALPVDVATRQHLLETDDLTRRLEDTARLVHALLESTLRATPPSQPGN